MLIEALRGGAAGLVNSATGDVVTRQRKLRTRVAGVAAGASALLLTVGGLCSAAHAQALDTGTQRDFAIKAGVFLPADKQVRTASATEIPMIEGDYTIQKYPESHFNSIASVGYIEHGALRIMPITVSQVYRDPNNAAGVNYYYGLGVGVYETRLSLPDTDGRVKSLVGGFVVVGLDLTKTIFAEAKYNYITRYDQKQVGGSQITLGLRF